MGVAVPVEADDASEVGRPGMAAWSPQAGAIRLVQMLEPPDPADGPVDVVIDADAGNEIDDQFAIVWAFLRPDRVRVEAVTACPFGYDAERQLAGPGTAALDKRAYAARLATSAGFPKLDPAEGVRLAEAEIVRIFDLLGEATVGRGPRSRSVPPGPRYAGGQRRR